MATTARPRTPRAAALLLAATSLIASCGAPARPTLTEAQLQERAAADAREMDATLHDAVGKVIARVERESASVGVGNATINFLAMSGGGDFGAFGAGFLVGWGQVSDAAWRRPDFDAVTGVSTGALLAPFAFVGTDEACLTVEDFYRNPKKDWIRKRGLLPFLPSNPSLATLGGLNRDVRAAINPDFIAQMAERSRGGRILAVSATDLDLGRQRFWELGAEAEAAVASGDYERVHRILLASAAIPVAFPPVEINDVLYADGGVSANVFLRLETRNPSSFIPRWKAANPGVPLPKVRYWIIVNNQLTHRPSTVQERWPAIVGPSLEVSIRSATLAEVRWLASEAEYVNAVYGTDIEVRVVAIPDDWRPPVEGSFQQKSMASLADLGRRLGADPASWKIMAAPRPTEGTGR